MKRLDGLIELSKRLERLEEKYSKEESKGFGYFMKLVGEGFAYVVMPSVAVAGTLYLIAYFFMNIAGN